ncbi:hypothetical protein F5883DRAFT_437698, partial [Diaporthe sp. PMI_573]
ISASAFMPKFVRFVRYIYNYTVPEYQLRLLIAQFAACIVKDMSNLKGWSALVNETPGFRADLIYQITNRFN